MVQLVRYGLGQQGTLDRCPPPQAIAGKSQREPGRDPPPDPGGVAVRPHDEVEPPLALVRGHSPPAWISVGDAGGDPGAVGGVRYPPPQILPDDRPVGVLHRQRLPPQHPARRRAAADDEQPLGSAEHGNRGIDVVRGDQPVKGIRRNADAEPAVAQRSRVRSNTVTSAACPGERDRDSAAGDATADDSHPTARDGHQTRAPGRGGRQPAQCEHRDVVMLLGRTRIVPGGLVDRPRSVSSAVCPGWVTTSSIRSMPKNRRRRHATR